MHLDLDLIFLFQMPAGTDVSVIWRSRAYPSFFVYLFVLALPQYRNNGLKFSKKFLSVN